MSTKPSIEIVFDLLFKHALWPNDNDKSDFTQAGMTSWLPYAEFLF